MEILCVTTIKRVPNIDSAIAQELKDIWDYITITVYVQIFVIYDGNKMEESELTGNREILNENFSNEDLLNKVMAGDAYQFLDRLDSNSVDLVLIDPPYNVIESSWDLTAINHLMLMKQFYRILKRNGQLVIFGVFTSLVPYFENKIEFKFNYDMIWDKRRGTMMVVPNRISNSHEVIHFYYKGTIENIKFDPSAMGNYDPVTIKYSINDMAKMTIKTISDKSMAEADGKSKIREFKLPLSVIFCRRVDPSHPEYIGHSTQKPTELLKKIILQCTNENDVVLDCFGGSGSTYVACKQIRRRFLGCELDPEYVLAIQKRLNDTNIEKNIFEKYETKPNEKQEIKSEETEDKSNKRYNPFKEYWLPEDKIPE